MRVRLRTLAVRDFRNLARVDITLPDEGAVVVGENGQGKSNLLEAIYYLGLLRSHRGARDQDLVRFGEAGFHISAHALLEGEREITVGFERATKRKRVRIDGSEPERLSDALGALPAVMFSPGDVELVAGAPSARRRYLDVMLALSSRRYLTALQRYRASLAHRNAALRALGRGGSRPSAEQVDARVSVWEPPLAQAGAVLWTERRAWAAAVATRFGELCHAIGEHGEVSLRFASSLPSEEGEAHAAAALAQALADKRGLDVKRGLTHAGPHRDDLAIHLDGRELRSFGSAGQQRSAAIALRMLEGETLRDRRGGEPLFLLDDPFAELDVRRSARILELLRAEGLGQTVLVVPRESDIPPELTRLERWRVEAGVLSRY